MKNNAATRRSFLRKGSLILLGAGLDWSQATRLLADEPTAKPLVRVGMVTDLHYADKPARGTRYYQESLVKLEEAARQFEKDQPDVVVELGDFIDSAGSVELDQSYLKRIHKSFSALPGQKHYILGNHCVEMLKKEEFLAGVGQEKSYYSFDQGGIHFIALDACFRSDGQPYGRQNSQWTDANILPAEVEWLAADLKANDKPVVVFAHQRLDVSNIYGVKNCAEVRKTLEDAGNVLAVFQGHNHKNDHREIGGIHYCTLVAMIEGTGAENNGYSTLDLFDGGTIRLSGFKKQARYAWE
jgi:alkaline phosphatase